METIKVNLSKSQLELISELLYQEKNASMSRGLNNWEYVDHLNKTTELIDQSLDKIFEQNENV